MTATAHVVPQSRRGADAVRVQCTVCGSELPAIDASHCAELMCHRCGFVVVCTGGVWRLLPPDRVMYFRRFMREYAEVRVREGRGSPDPDHYRALPFRDLSGRNTWQWAIRARTFRFFAGRILSHIEREHSAPLRILDIGAGNAWLSYRLALRHHLPVALDLLDNDDDGLGAARHYFGACPPFLRVQAEMDSLPFAAAQFDLVIFNASFHYSQDYAATVREALRCTRPGGHIVVLDSPFYRRARSGEQMLAERRAQFLAQYGFPSDSVPSREFLTRDDLSALRRSFQVDWQVLRPWYGWQWALRPWKARLQRRREPARFHILWGRVPH